MLLDEVFLDEVYWESFERLAIREGWIVSENDSECIHPVYFQPRESENIPHKSKVLLLLTLFERLDSSCSIFNLERFRKHGIIRNDALIYGKYDPIFDHFMNGKTEDARLMLNAHNNTYELLKLSKQKVIRHIVNSNGKGFYIHNSRTRVNIADLNKEYSVALDWYRRNNDMMEIYNKKPHLTRFLTDISLIWTSVRFGIYQASKSNTSLATSFTSNQSIPYKKTENLIEDLYYLVRTRLTDEIVFLPKPRCIDEAIELRERKEMRRFREVLNGWLLSLDVCDSQAEKKIRNDLRKANRSLKAIKHWHEYQRSPLNFWLNSIGGHIPVLSNIITVIYTVGALSSGHFEKKANWIALIKE